MKALFSLFMLWSSIACASWFADKPQEMPPATIKVLLLKHADGALLEAKGSYEVVNPEDHKHLSSGFRGKRFYVHPHSRGVKWGEDFPDIFQLKIIPKSPETTFLVDGVQYKGCLEVYHIDGKIHLVNEVDIENYLKSRLTTYFLDADLKTEVMDAVTIAERTHAYYTVMRSEDAFWHVDAKKVGYNGCGLTLQNLNVDRSVDATRHLIMAYEGKPFASGWTPNCGGKTASFKAIFRKNIPCPEGVKSPFALRDRDEHKWTYQVTKDKLAQLAKTNRVTGIELFVDEPSKKVYGIQVQDGSHHSNIDFFTLQEALGKTQIKSNDFSVKIEGDSIAFKGYGEGVGVGLCLYSADQMAEKGDLAPEILATFFPYTHIQQQRTLPGKRGLYEEHHVITTDLSE